MEHSTNYGSVRTLSDERIFELQQKIWKSWGKIGIGSTNVN
ncbi:MAG: hypothetical protein WCV90_06165 [Candidatus Woesearchaeota archaeon]